MGLYLNMLIKAHTVVRISNVCSKSGPKTHKLVKHRTCVQFLNGSATLEVSEYLDNHCTFLLTAPYEIFNKLDFYEFRQT